MERDGKKRKEKDPYSTIHFDSNDINHFFAAMTLIRDSAIYNMVCKAGSVYTASMCVCALWGLSDLVFKLNRDANSSGLDSQWFHLMKMWWKLDKTSLQQSQDLYKALPLGEDYMNALFSERFLPPSSKVKTYADFVKYHKLDWAKGFVIYAEEKCEEKGRFARDVVKLECLRGAFKNYLLKAVGSQLLSQ